MSPYTPPHPGTRSSAAPFPIPSAPRERSLIRAGHPRSHSTEQFPAQSTSCVTLQLPASPPLPLQHPHRDTAPEWLIPTRRRPIRAEGRGAGGSGAGFEHTRSGAERRERSVSRKMSSIFQSVAWRSHNVLENIDEQDSPQPDKFRKRPSSSSLNTVRMSLRKRMPLKPVEVNINAVPDWSRVGVKEKRRPLQSMTVTAMNMFDAMSKKLKKNGSQYLLESPNEVQSAIKQIRTPKNIRKSCTARTPKCRRLMEEASPNGRVTPKSSKRASPYTKRASGSQWKSFSNIVGNEGLNLRRSVRAASLNSPYASPVIVSRRRQFEKDLESVSTGIRQLKRLSRVFDDAIVKEERKEAILNYHSLMTRNLRCSRNSRLSWRSTRKLQHTLGGWTEVALTSIGNIGAR